MTQPSKTTKLTKDEVDRLISDYQTKQDEQAQETLVRVYTNLVDMLAKKYSKGKSFHEDLRQVGMIGLLGAIKRYDPVVGKSFEAFAIPTIIGEIKRFLRDKTWSVHVPRRIKELGPRIKMAVDQLTTETQRSPKRKRLPNSSMFLKKRFLKRWKWAKAIKPYPLTTALKRIRTEALSRFLISSDHRRTDMSGSTSN